MNSNLSDFTDVLDDIDVIEDSQPISISPDEFVHNTYIETNIDSKESNAQKPVKGTGQYGYFRSIEEIEPKYRGVFTYPYFNFVQSKVIEDALYSDKSMVVCAPTGSGKTVVFEMAIVQLLMEIENNKSSEDYKIIYMAPVKALCAERLTEWCFKFTRLGLMCIEVTGDTDVDFSQLNPYRIIITTPEKWDMLTRRWRDHRGLVGMIKLFLIDEVHILNDVTRGPVLEAVVSRMKTIESAAQSAHTIEQLQKEYGGTEVTSTAAPPKIRFVAVSATVGNPEDVASWLGTTERPAVIHKFGDECRPVKVKRVVEGYHCPNGMSIFKFDIILNYKLWPIIQKYHNGKPTLIFCNTRKSVLLTAETLSRELTVNFDPQQKAKLTALASTIKNKKLQTLLLNGVGCHHAGLLFEERQNIEQAFRNKDLPILITTTTLAMGVNLPAHLVIIKNTQQYINGAYQEYSMSTVLQMVGRAGRPQYDTEATAVIMTTVKDKPRYQALVGGCEPLQSYLDKRLPENLNSEAALGTVGDVAQCVQWLRSTFLYVRAGRDPRRYLGLPPTAPQELISKKIQDLCVKAMNGLASSGMITMDEACCIQSTEAGRLMSLYYLDLESMKQIMKIKGSETLEQLLWIVCECHELADTYLRMDERRLLNSLNRNRNATTIRFPMNGKINTRQMKLNCVIQAVLGCLPIPDPSLNQEAMKIMRIVDRICKCLVAYVTRSELIPVPSNFYSAVLNSLILAKCVFAQLWENSPYVSKQLRGIGPTLSNLLATAGKVNFRLLEESHPRDLERIINKGPPMGNALHKLASLLPKYQLSITPLDEYQIAIQLLLLNQAYLSENLDNLTAGSFHKCHIVVGDSDNNLLLLKSFKDKDLISTYDGSITYQIRRKHNFEHKIFVNCISTSFVGIDAKCEYLFKDLEPSTSHLNVFIEPNITKTINKKQSTITNTFKLRKRRNNEQVTESKEKKKKSTDVMEKFHKFKESFDTSSKVIEDLDKTAEISNDFDNEFMTPFNENAMNIDELSETNAQKKGKSVLLDTDIEQTSSDELDDEKIDNILKKIENEMSKSSHSNQEIVRINTPVTKNNDSSWRNPKLFNNSRTNYKSSFGVRLGKVTRKSNTNTNYKFIDLLERTTDLTEDEEESRPVNNNNGFTETIKAQIENYLKKSHIDTRTPNKIVDELINENVETELPSVCLQSRKDSDASDKNISDGSKISEANNATVDAEIQNDIADLSKETEKKTFDNVMHNNTLNNASNSNMLTPLIRTCSLTDISTAFDSSCNYHFNNINIPAIKAIKDQTLNCNNEKALILRNPNNPNLENQVKLHSDLPSNLQVLNKETRGISFAFKNSINNKTVIPDEDVQITVPHLAEIDFPSTSRSPIKSETVNQEKRKYLYSITNIEHTTKNMPDRLVRITRKLKLDLDVIEIKPRQSQANEHSNIEANKDNKKVKFDRNSQNKKSINIDCMNAAKKSNDTKDEIFLHDDTNLKITDLKKIPEESEEILNKAITTENTVAEVLQKHYNRFRKKSDAAERNRTHLKINNCGKPTSKKMVIPKRPFKISQINKIHAPLLETVIGNSSAVENIMDENIKETHQVLLKFQNLPDKPIEIELPSVDLSVNKSPECRTRIDLDLEPDLQIDQKLFDPQVLLRSLNTDENHIIPPPPEFANDEPRAFADINALEVPNSGEAGVCNNFCINSQTTALPEAETWVLTRNSSKANERFNWNHKPFGVAQKYFSVNSSPSSAPVSSRHKLEQFTYRQKEKLKK